MASMPLVYILHSSAMYGTERMSMATAQGLAGDFKTIFVGPRGPAMWEAQRLGFQTHYFQTTKALGQIIRPLLQGYPSLTFASTLPRFSIMCMALNVVYRRPVKQVYVVHGSCEELKDFARIRYLNPLDITMVAVSQYVKQRLMEHGARADRIEVVPNFLLPEQIAAAPRRGPFTAGVERALCALRVVEAKRFDVLLDAIARHPELADFPINVAGGGAKLETLSRQAQMNCPSVNFLGFVKNVSRRYAESDLLIHPCPTEAFGLVVIEAMAAGIPVLVADEGGPATLVQDGVNGFKFRANDPDDLARRLIELRRADPQRLNRVVANAAESLRTNLSAAQSLARYRRIFAPRPDMAQTRHPVLYVLHSSQLYGTERMALATAQGLADEFETIFIGPPGVGLVEAQRLGFETRQYRTSKDLAFVLRPLLKRYPSLTFIGTGPRYNLVCIALNLLYRRRIKHIQILHGGSGIDKDYAHKKVLNFFDITFIVVSQWSRQRLIDYGVRNRIEVIGNFLMPDQLAAMPKRPTYDQPGVQKALVVSRIAPDKRVDLLLDALDRGPSDLRDISFRVLGVGPDFEKLRDRAAKTRPNVEFAGFSDNVAAELAGADLLVHTCPIETFGLAVLEAMGARLAALVPDRGGTATLIDDGVCGFTYRADDPDHLAQRLVELKDAPADLLNRMVANAAAKVDGEFSADAALRRYRQLFAPD